MRPQPRLLYKGRPTSTVERRQFGNAALILRVAAATINHAPSQMHLWAKVSGTFPGLWHRSAPLSSHTWSGHAGTGTTRRHAVILEKPRGASRAFTCTCNQNKNKQTKNSGRKPWNNLPVYSLKVKLKAGRGRTSTESTRFQSDQNAAPHFGGVNTHSSKLNTRVS